MISNREARVLDRILDDIHNLPEEKMHTPGPWRVERGRIEFGPYVAGDGWGVAKLLRDGATAEQVTANGQLIAASPTILSALVNLLDAPDLNLDDLDPATVAAITEARSAVAAATGK